MIVIMLIPEKKPKAHPQTDQQGVVLLFVIIVLTAVFTISVGVFHVILSQISASQTFENSDK